MKCQLDGNELIIKLLFSKKRYNFKDLTKVSFVDGICIYQNKECIFREKNIDKIQIYSMDIFHLAVKNNLIFEDEEWFNDEISVDDVSKYSISIQDMFKKQYYNYIKQELGEDYEFVISTDSTPYHVRIFLNITHNGEKVYAYNSPFMTDVYTTWLNGKKDVHLSIIELIMPHYIDAQKHDFRLTKLVDFTDIMDDLNQQIQIIKDTKK